MHVYGSKFNHMKGLRTEWMCAYVYMHGTYYKIMVMDTGKCSSSTQAN